MSTPLSDVFALFMQKISDYSFLNLTQGDLENILIGYLISATVKFKSCKKDLSDRDLPSKVFNVDLTDEEKEILATQMVVEWLTPQITSVELTKQTLTTKEWSMYSQANHLKELKDLKKEMKKEVSQLISAYSYSLDDVQ